MHYNKKKKNNTKSILPNTWKTVRFIIFLDFSRFMKNYDNDCLLYKILCFIMKVLYVSMVSAIDFLIKSNLT